MSYEDNDHKAHRAQEHAMPRSTSATAATERHVGHHTADFLKKFWLSLALTFPILAYSPLFEVALGFSLPSFPGATWLVLLLGSVVFWYCGWAFLIGAYREVRARLPGMMTLIALATGAAYLWSLYATFAGKETLFWELSTLIAIMLLGHFVEMKAVSGASGALRELAMLLPDTAEVIRGDGTVTVSLSELKEGDVVLIKPGAKVPADGVVIEGKSDINESIITGESRLVPKETHGEVIAGSINGAGSLKVRITKVGEDTFLSGVLRLVREAEASKSRLQILSDTAAVWLTGIAISAGGITFVSWLLVDAGIVFATERLVAVLIIACPHALGLAVPLVAAISTTMAAQNGFLIKRRLSLESARNIDVVLFDKTGTLTKGEFGVHTILSHSDARESEILRLAASVNAESEHSLARAIVGEAKNRGLSLEKISGFTAIPGKGARAQIGSDEISIGSEKLFAEALPPTVNQLEKEGKTVVHLGKNGKLVGSIALVDVIREESKEAVRILKERGISVAMITGDSEDVALWVSRELGIEEYFARVLPGEKSEKVKLLQKDGSKVAMVGDGVNDAPALTQADLGIAIGAGTNVAVESAGIILVRNDPRDIPKIIRLSKMTYAKMIQNLLWATGYNIVALPLAAGAAFTWGILLEPALAAVLMSASTVIVAVNAVLLRRLKL